MAAFAEKLNVKNILCFVCKVKNIFSIPFCLGPVPCPSGYERRDGDIPGWGTDIGSALSLTREECADACTDENQCLSFEHSNSASLCNLNKMAEPTNEENYLDYAFCTKTGG